jgi:coenzyme F420 hydrogenase subunit beta
MKLPEKPFDIKYFGNLLKEVIDAEICSHCATCVTICPVHGIKAGDRPIYFPDWESDCVDCGACIDVCPRWKFRPLSGIGPYLELLSARSVRREGQDGGIVTEIMAGALELGMIDKAIVVSRDEFWKTLPVHIRYAEQLQYEGFRGTKYSFADSLPEIRYAVNTTRKGIGVIGTPCMVSGLRKLQKFSGIYKKIKIIVGLFCTENFYHHQLRDFLLHKKIDIKDANKINIKKGKFILSMKNKDVSFKVEELEPIVPSGCKVCQDFTGVESDVSVGGVGSEEGFSSVIVRTEPAKIVFDYIRENDYVILGEVKKELIEKLVSFKVKIHPYPKNERRV